MTRSFKRTVGLGLCLAFFATGCIGNFGLVGEVRKFNLEQTQDRWGREILFVILYVIPIYPLAGAADLLVFNAIEFWTGKNPINGSQSTTPLSYRRSFETEEGAVVTMTLREDGSIDVVALGAAGDRHFVNLVRTNHGVAARDDSGTLIGTAPRGHMDSAWRRSLPPRG